MDTLIFYGITMIIIILGIILYLKADSIKSKDKNLSFLLTILGVNLTAIPFSLFIGVMATDAPDSDMYDFLFGFLFVQAIPLFLLIVSIVKFFITRGKDK